MTQVYTSLSFQSVFTLNTKRPGKSTVCLPNIKYMPATCFRSTLSHPVYTDCHQGKTKSHDTTTEID